MSCANEPTNDISVNKFLWWPKKLPNHYVYAIWRILVYSKSRNKNFMGASANAKLAREHVPFQQILLLVGTISLGIITRILEQRDHISFPSVDDTIDESFKEANDIICQSISLDTAINAQAATELILRQQ